MKYFIVNNTSRAAVYGIGTYVRQLTRALSKHTFLQLYFIDLYSDNQEFTVEKDENGLTHYKIPMAYSRIEDDRYCHVVYYLLYPYLPENEAAIFHFNYYQHYSLALLLKACNIHHCIFLSIHYLNWCFELNGNVTKFRNILQEKVIEAKYQPLVDEYRATKHFLHLADKVLVLSRFCKDLLKSDYEICEHKLHLVYNGLQEEHFSVTEKKGNNPIILFVGRLDPIKGVKYLIKAFRQVLQRYEHAQLVIVDDGDYNEYLNLCKGIWEKVTFTGKIPHEELQVFHQQATIGVMPSFHEQCSYSAIEYMMHGIPFVGTTSTGLSEMLDCVPQLRVPIREKDFSEEEFITDLANAMCLLLDNETVRQKASEKMLAQFNEKYSLQAMQKNLAELITPEIRSTDIPLSSAFLEELDDYMISLIHDKADIDTDFYGMAGIGVYLWWRISQPKMLTDEFKVFKIKEYLIYYIDWFYEAALYEKKNSCEPAFALMLQEMYQARFYTTKVGSLMELLHCEQKGECMKNISSLEILQNAMHMFITKI